MITDLRKDALNMGKEWGSEILDKDVRILTIDAREVHELKEKFDIALIYGLSTPHFNPWDIVRLFYSVSQILVDDGLFIVDESDRRSRIFLNQGYKWSLAEILDSEKFIMSFHTGYDVTKGTCKRTYINFTNPTKPVTTELFMWGLAEVGALIWTFFKDVDLLNLIGTKYFILGYKPRKILKPEEMKEPFVIRDRIQK